MIFCTYIYLYIYLVNDQAFFGPLVMCKKNRTLRWLSIHGRIWIKDEKQKIPIWKRPNIPTSQYGKKTKSIKPDWRKTKKQSDWLTTTINTLVCDQSYCDPYSKISRGCLFEIPFWDTSSLIIFAEFISMGILSNILTVITRTIMQAKITIYNCLDVIF